jgi:tetratricopeptide (TPR) repeat protein
MKARGCVIEKSRFLQIAENIEEAIFCDHEFVKAAHESWIAVLTPKADYWDLALALCLHLLARENWKMLIEQAHNMVLATEEARVSSMFFDVLSRIDKAKVRRKLDSRHRVFLLDALGIHEIRQGRNRDALAHLTKMLEIARRAGDVWGVGQALLHKGIAWVNSRNLWKAEQSYRHAESWARKHGDDMLLGRVLNNLFSCLLQRDPNLASQVIEESIQAKKRAGDRLGLTAVYGARGILAADAKQYKESVLWFRRTERTARKYGDRYAETQSLHNQSISLLALSRYQEAIACERRAYEIAKGLERAELVELVTQGLAMGLYQAGQYKAALPKFFDVYEAKLARGDISGAITALSDAGGMAFNLGDHAGAKKYFRMGIRRGLLQKEYDCLDKPILNLSVVLVKEGKPKQALRFLFARLDRFESIRRWKVVVSLARRILAMLEENQGESTEREVLWRRALGAAKKSKDVEAQIDFLMARYNWIRDRGDSVATISALKPLLQLTRQHSEFLIRHLEAVVEFSNEIQKLGDYSAAARLYQMVLNVANVIKANRIRSVILINLAETLRRAERPGEAVPLYRQAIELCELERDNNGLLTAKHNLALALDAVGRKAMAKGLLEQVRDRSRCIKDWERHGNAWLALGDLALTAGKKRLAVSRYRRATEVGAAHGVQDLVHRVAEREPQLVPKVA